MFDRNYLIIPVSELKKINFDQVLETSAEHLRYSIDRKKTFIKWEGVQPEFVANIKKGEGPYSFDEMTEILNCKEWIPIEEDAK